MTIHIAGLDVLVGALMRQRCAWCGEILEDRDLAAERVLVEAPDDARALDPDGKLIDPVKPYRGWPVGHLVEVTATQSGAGTFMVVVDHRDGDKLPADCCANLD